MPGMRRNGGRDDALDFFAQGSGRDRFGEETIHASVEATAPI